MNGSGFQRKYEGPERLADVVGPVMKGEERRAVCDCLAGSGHVAMDDQDERVLERVARLLEWVM
jgi:hypothetical protein